MKYFAVSTNNGQVSGLKETLKEVEDWAETTLLGTKASKVYIFETIGELSVAPRTIQGGLYPEVLERKTTPDVKCETCDPAPLKNGSYNHLPIGDPFNPAER